jgi:hypothetical protein
MSLFLQRSSFVVDAFLVPNRHQSGQKELWSKERDQSSFGEMFVSTAAACRFPSLCMSCFWRSWKRQYCCILDFHPQTFKTQYKTTLCCVAGKNSSVQSPPKYRLKNIAWLLTVFVISLYSDYFRDVDICQCSEYKQSDIIYLSSETQRQKSLENTRITGNGAKIFAKAKTLAAREDYSTAQKLYQQLIQEAPNFAPAYSNLANIEVGAFRILKEPLSCIFR